MSCLPTFVHAAQAWPAKMPLHYEATEESAALPGPCDRPQTGNWILVPVFPSSRQAETVSDRQFSGLKCHLVMQLLIDSSECFLY